MIRWVLVDYYQYGMGWWMVEGSGTALWLRYKYKFSP